MSGERIIVSALVLAFGLCYGNVLVPLHSSQLKTLNNEVQEEVFNQAYFKLKSVAAQLEASEKTCLAKSKRVEKRCKAAHCGNLFEVSLQKVMAFVNKVEKELKNLVSHERLKKAWVKVKKTLDKLKKPLRNIGNAAKKLVRNVGRGISRAFREVGRGVSRAVRKLTRGVKHVIRDVNNSVRRILRVRIRLPRFRFRLGKKKKRGIYEDSACSFCKSLGDAKDDEAKILSLVCGSSYQQDQSRLMNQAVELERLMTSLEKEDRSVNFVTKVHYDQKSISFANQQLSFSKVYVTLNAKGHSWTFQSPKPLFLVPFKPSTLVTPITKRILPRYGVN